MVKLTITFDWWQALHSQSRTCQHFSSIISSVFEWWTWVPRMLCFGCEDSNEEYPDKNKTITENGLLHIYIKFNYWYYKYITGLIVALINTCCKLSKTCCRNITDCCHCLECSAKWVLSARYLLGTSIISASHCCLSTNLS